MIIHLVPDNDLCDHFTESTSCQCDYTTTIINSHLVIVHASCDLREMVEQANMILGNEDAGFGWTLFSKDFSFQ